MMATEGRLSVLCVEDSAQLAAALRIRLSKTADFAWAGWLADADSMALAVQRDRPTIVILDLDMPGKDPFEALRECTERCPSSRIVVFSGHVRPELIDRAFEAGAWGYVSKNDGQDALIAAIREVLGGTIARSPEVRAVEGHT